MIYKILTRDKKAFAKYLFACTFFVTELLFVNYAIARIARVIETKSITDLWHSLLLGAASIIYSALIFIVSRFLRLQFMRDTTLYIREKAFESIMIKSYESFGKKLKNEYISNLVNDINTFESQFFLSLLNIINNLAIYITASILLVILSPLLGIVVFCASLIALAYIYLYQKKTIDMQEKIQEYNEDLTVNVSNTFSGLEILKLNRIEDRFLHNSLGEIEKLGRKRYHFFVFTLWQDKSLAFFGTIFILGLVYYITGLFSSGYSLTKIMFLIQLSNFVAFPVAQIPPLINKLKSNSAVISKIIDPCTLDTDKKKTAKTGTGQNQRINISSGQKTSRGSQPHGIPQSPPSAIQSAAAPEDISGALPFIFQKNIEVKDLTFSHGKKLILTDVNLKLEKGKKYLVRGQSGSGKSTLIGLLSGIYENYSGTITVDGVDIREIREEDYNNGIALIYQDVFLFEDSLRNNIALYKKYEDEEILSAAYRAGLKGFLEKTPDGLDTFIDENGKNLSGGERQRVSIARALIRKPELLLGDEITSALDDELGRSIEKTLLSLDTTVVNISHKFFSGVSEGYDGVIFIDGGRAGIIPMEEYLRQGRV